MANNLPLPPYSASSAAEKASLRPYAESAAKTLRAGLKNGASDAGLKQIIKDTNTMSPWKYARNYQTVGKPLDLYAKAAKFSAGKALDATKHVAKGALGRAAPWVGAALGANELRKNVPALVKGVPAYMQERKALKQSEANLKKLKAKAAGMLKTKFSNLAPKPGEDVYAREARLYGLNANR